jgi:hypothetical protein
MPILKPHVFPPIWGLLYIGATLGFAVQIPSDSGLLERYHDGPTGTEKQESMANLNSR